MITITSKGDELLETRLNEVTNPLNTTFNEQAVIAFCDQVNKEPEGHQVAVRLLAHKVQSPQEKEALYAFNVLDECIKRCGSKFHQEIGKFRFLNELIKIISPKYLARGMSSAVKTRCTECLYSLYKGIPHETKIGEAYNMLKKQKIIVKDPTHIDDKIFRVNIESKQHSIFDSSKDSEKLSKLLKSRNPNDLREANKIIKSIVQEDNQRIEMISKRASELETMKNNIKLLNEMLSCYNANETTTDDMDIMKQLTENLEQSRAEMFKLSRETDDNDFINDVIKVIDDCNSVMKRYWEITNQLDSRSTVNNTNTVPKTDNSVNLLGDDIEEAPANNTCTSESLLKQELGDLGLSDIKIPSNAGSTSTTDSNKSKYHDLLDVFSQIPTTNPNQASNSEILQNLATSQSPIPSSQITTSSLGSLLSSTYTSTTTTTSSALSNNNYNIDSNVKSTTTVFASKNKSEPVKGFEDLDILGKEMMNIYKIKTETSVPSTQDDVMISNDVSKPNIDSLLLIESPTESAVNATGGDLPMLMTDLLETGGGDANMISVVDSDSSVSGKEKEEKLKQNEKPSGFKVPSLSTNINSDSSKIDKVKLTSSPSISGGIDLSKYNIQLSSIKPHSLKLPLTIYNDAESKLKIMLHFSNDQLDPDVYVMVAQISSENPNHQITDISLKFAVAKPMKIRRQTSGVTTLQPHSPFTPSTPINDIIILYNPTKSQPDLKFQLSYDINGESYLESGSSRPIGF